MNDRYAEIMNVKRWDELAAIHARSDYYRVENFLNDPSFSTLSVIEKAEIGDIQNKTLLHLQCHIGVDTLSLERQCAIVTGVDFSQNSIEQAQSLAKQVSSKADFIVSNIYDLPKMLDRQFDIVYVNWGSLCWLKDLQAWGAIVSRYLKPGGFLYLAEIHPFGLTYFQDKEYPSRKSQPYFADKKNLPRHLIYNHTYAEQNTIIENKDFYQWTYPVGDIITIICQNGMKIEFFHEYPYSSYEQIPGMHKLKNGLYAIPDDQTQIPLSFTLKARKL